MVLYNGMASTSPCAALYFVALMTFGNYVLFNLLVAILVEGFQAEVRHLPPSSLDSSYLGQQVIAYYFHSPSYFFSGSASFSFLLDVSVSAPMPFLFSRCPPRRAMQTAPTRTMTGPPVTLTRMISKRTPCICQV